MNKIQRKANAEIVQQVENYRSASKSKKAARQQIAADTDKTIQRKPAAYAIPDSAERAFQMQMDRASGALDVLDRLFPDLPAWTETKWVS